MLVTLMQQTAVPSAPPSEAALLLGALQGIVSKQLSFDARIPQSTCWGSGTSISCVMLTAHQNELNSCMLPSCLCQKLLPVLPPVWF